MKTIASQVVHVRAVTRAQHVGFGLPCKKGLVKSPEAVRLVQDGNVLDAFCQDRGRWPDGSIRWLWCEALVSHDGHIDLAQAESSVQLGADLVGSLRSELQKPALDAPAFLHLASTNLTEVPVRLGVRIKFKGEQQYQVPGNLKLKARNAGGNQTLDVTGAFPWAGKRLEFAASILFCIASGQMNLSIRLHNPEAAVHPDGCWDLGDAASAYIDDFVLTFDWPDSRCTLTVADAVLGATISTEQQFMLTQSASGGEHWQSPIHWDANRELTVKSNGYTLVDAAGLNQSGLRAQPRLLYSNSAAAIAVELLHFWENFPITVDSEHGQTQWHLFPQATELQGGESKTWQFRLALPTDSVSTISAGSLDQLWSARIRYNVDYLNQSGVLPHLQLDSGQRAFADLIDIGIDATEGFKAKRERIDVYGWRNFGDLYADHETHGLPPQPYFISLYNNQYDPLMGMTLQYLQSGDDRWLELFEPLNRHLQDIDIYDTEKDKAEYNGGLFWHTNHYLPAETCSHRSYSKHHTAVYDNFSAGGGPGGQHCYTTGLMLQYHLFGDLGAGQRVTQLSRWVRRFYNGNGTLLDRSFRFLTIDLKAAGFCNIGNKAPGFRYPLDRGTGNYLVALLDAFEVTQDSALMDEVAFVIRNTCHPAEDLSTRNLLDVENAWFYTVFLQAVARFLFLKNSFGQQDADFAYARACLLNFARWMRDNERFYLDRPEILEFPNDTWCAQDLRKATIYAAAASLEPDAESRRAYLTARDNVVDYVRNRLNTSVERGYARILALLMQTSATVMQSEPVLLTSPITLQQEFGPVPTHNPVALAKTYLIDMLKLLTRLSISNEWLWFKQRFLK